MTLDAETIATTALVADPTSPVGRDAFDLLAAAVTAYMNRCERRGACLVMDCVSKYGEVRFAGHRIPANRASYIVHHGPIPAGLVVRHKCDVSRCVEPAHLEVGTTSQNERDKRRQNHDRTKGKTRGTAVWTAQMSPAQVVEMRRAVRAGESIRDVANRYPFSYAAIRYAVRGVTWKHVSEPIVPMTYHWSHPSPRRTRAELCQRVLSMVDEGQSLADIGQALGISLMTAWRITQREQLGP